MNKLIILIAIIGLHMQLSAQGIVIFPQVRMLALGDSYTIGESVEMDQRWPHQFVEALRVKGVQAQEPDYVAVTGWTTADLLKAIQNSPDAEKGYNLVSILIGVNNQYQGLDMTIYEPELKQIIDFALELVNQDTSRIFMLSIPDYAYTPFGKGNPDISKGIDAYNNINARLAQAYGIVRVDITGISRKGLDQPSLIAEDGLHPSGEQYRAWIDKILPKLLYY